MEPFDKTDPARHEERGFPLSVFSLVVIAILLTVVCFSMYSAVSSRPIIFTTRTSKIFFFGFCALSLLLLGYLIERHVVVRRLRREITKTLDQCSEIKKGAARDLLSMLSGMNQFQDRLAMEFRRAASMKGTLSVIVIRLKPAEGLTDPWEIVSATGDAVKAISRNLRHADSLYHFRDEIFGTVMPDVDFKDGQEIAARFAEELSEVAGAPPRFNHDVSIFNYPRHAATAHELEDAVRSLIPKEKVPEPSLVATLKETSEDSTETEGIANELIHSFSPFAI